MTTILDLLDTTHGSTASLTEWPPSSPSSSLSDLWRKSGKVAGWFSTRSEPGGAVGLVLENTSDCIATLIGAWRSGLVAASLPLRTVGTSNLVYVDELGGHLRAIGADLLIAPEVLAHRHGDAEAFAGVKVGAFESVVASAENGSGRARDEPGRFIQFSSGTSSNPKGVDLSLGALAANARAIVERFDRGHPMVSGSWLPLSHDMGLVGLCLAPWVYSCAEPGRAGEIILARPETFLRAPRSWMRMCSQHRVTVTGGPNFALESAANVQQHSEELDLTSLEVVCVGAERVWPETLRTFDRVFASMGLSPTAICPAYGMAEATLGVAASGPGDNWSAKVVEVAEGPSEELVSCGPALDGVEVRTKPSGEIEVRSPALLSSYVHRPGPVVRDGWFSTGDFGLVSAGELFVSGRQDDLISVAGRNVSASAVERAIREALRAELSAVVVVEAGSSRFAVVCAREPSKTQIKDDELARRVREETTRAMGLPPAEVVLVPRRSIARTGTGKLKRAHIARAYAQNSLRSGPGH